MSILFPLIAGCALLPAAEPDKPDKSAARRYVRADGGKLVTAAEVDRNRDDDGTTVTTRSPQARGKMTLTLRYDRDGKLTSAEAVDAARKGAVLTLGEKGAAIMKRGGITDFLKDLPANPIIVVGPDWTDALQVVGHYDAAKGGKQEFGGVSIDPVQGARKQTFSAERQAADKVTVKGKEMKLDRFRLKARGGEYTAWADAQGRVVRVQGLAPKAVPVVLDGFEEATRDLKP